MEQILRGSFGVNSRLSKLNRKQGVVTRCGLYVTLKYGPQLKDAWNYSTLQHIRRGRTPLSLYVGPSTIPKRNFGLLFRAVKKVLKLRYLLLGGAVSGSLTLQKAYEDWKNNLPDLQWLDDVFPDSDKWKSFGVSLIEIKDKIKENVEMDSRLKQLIHTKYENYKDWFNNRLDKALEAAEESSQTESISWGFLQTIFPELDPKKSSKGFFDTSNEKKVDYVKKKAADVIETADRNGRENIHHPVGSNNMESIRFAMHLNKGTVGEGSQREMLHIQLKYQKELEKLEKENKELRKQLLLNKKDVATKKIKKSLIDMYSDVLDELSEYDSSYNTQDHLPRVVVVGDQSSGKTSVLEMVAQARIFPRGAGEMMTRAPVKVTLSEGPYHIAQFKDSAREFDLTKESDLAELRKEVEIRMKNSVRGGKTVSQEVISMSVKGPGLQRMVLVDLPGIISTVTKEMASDTREAIRKMTETYMSNPNAIILCIQDGSVDAERSNVTDLVSHVDPQGKRTIFVLTKVDLAEDNLTNPERIKKILSGKLFPMKALGYFAVVTGRGRKDESIQDIRDYEQQFFRNSKLFSDGMILSSQLTTRNLSLAVAECFWKMVRETVEQQADAFKATRFNLEAEWKNNFPRLRELDRDELFERARGEMLDEVINLSQVSPKQWEELLEKKLWEKVSTYVFENIYLTAAQSGETGQFKTTVDIKLKQWVEQQLAVKSVESGWEVLREEFANFLNKTKNSKERDSIFDELKTAVFNEAIERHTWEDKAFETLRAIQMNTLEDRSVSEKEQWDSAIKFFETSIRDRLEQNKSTLKQMFGPGFLEKWTYWKYLTPEQSTRSKIKKELDRLLSVNPRHGPSLSYEELAAIRKNLQNEDINVEMEFIKETWHPVYRNHFLNKSLGKSYECKKDFYMYQQGLESEVECSDVVLFWRLEQMLKVTSHALRQQIMNREARRLEKEIKEILEEYSQDQAKKEKLLTGRRVTLAEELKRVRQIQEKLEEFIQALNKEN